MNDAKIYINGKFLTQKTTGVQRFAFEIIKELDKIVPRDRFILLAPKGANCNHFFKNISYSEIGCFKGTLWEQFSFGFYVKHRGGLSLNLCNASPIVAPGITCIHDAAIAALPQNYSWKFRTWYKLLFSRNKKRSPIVFTDSEFSKKELVRFFQIKEGRIVVLYCGWQHMNNVPFANDQTVLAKYGLEKDGYFFSLSSLNFNKNFQWIVQAANNNPTQIFVVAGSVNRKIFKENTGSEIPNNIKLIGYVEDSEAKTLMKNCRGFIFPSFYEGFGIPPLEAMACGAKTIIVSDIPVMREIYGDDAVYINPENGNIDLSLIEPRYEIRSSLDRYSWAKSARALYDAIADLLGR